MQIEKSELFSNVKEYALLKLLLYFYFQENGTLHLVHEMGAIMCFFFGLLYMCFQTLISYKIHRAGLGNVGWCLLATRLILCIAAVASACLDGKV